MNMTNDGKISKRRTRALQRLDYSCSDTDNVDCGPRRVRGSTSKKRSLLVSPTRIGNACDGNVLANLTPKPQRISSKMSRKRYATSTDVSPVGPSSEFNINTAFTDIEEVIEEVVPEKGDN